MDYPLRDYHLRPLSTKSSPTRYADYERVEDPTQPYEYTNSNYVRPVGSNRPIPSAAVRRALQVLDESYKQQNTQKCPSAWTNGIRERSISPYKSRTPSPTRGALCITPDYNITPPRILELEKDNLQNALGDSETRRTVLLRKLAEAQKTMEIQNERIRNVQVDFDDSKATVRLLQQVQQELETKTKYLEKERSSYLSRQIKDGEEKETLKRQSGTYHHEIKRLQCQLDLLMNEKEKDHESLEKMRNEVQEGHEKNIKLLETKDSMSEDISSLGQTVENLKQKIEIAEQDKERSYTELRKVHESQQDLITRNADLSDRLSKAEESEKKIRSKVDEYEISLQTYKRDKEMYTEKCSKQGYKIAELQTTYKETKSDLDRSVRYTSELEKTLQSLTSFNQQLKETKVSLEDNVTKFHADLSKARLELCTVTEEKNRSSEDLEALQKSHRELVIEHSEVRHKLSTTEEDLRQAESVKQVESQKMTLLETLNKQIEKDNEDLHSRLAILQQVHDELKHQTEQDARKGSQQIIELTSDKERLSGKCKDFELRLERSHLELTATAEHDQAQLDHWRQTCTKLTTLIEEKDSELRENAARLRITEEAADKADAERRNLYAQLSTMDELKRELEELKTENKRLTKQCKENRQMISVLEMEKEVLSKSPSKSSNANDNSLLGPEVRKLQTELRLALDKLTSAETDKRIADDKENERLLDELMKSQNKCKLSTNQILQSRKETESLTNLLQARGESHEAEIRKFERERERLDSRILRLEDEARVMRSTLTSAARSPVPMVDASELKHVKLEMATLQKEKVEKEQAYLIAKGQLVVAENAKKTSDSRAAQLEQEIDLLREENRTKISKSVAEVADKWESTKRVLETTKAKLEAVAADAKILRSRIKDLSDVKEKQEKLIKTLKSQLKDMKEIEEKELQALENLQENERSNENLRRELMKALAEKDSCEKHLEESKMTLETSLKNEQKARQERDELKGKTIIMESINDSSTDLRQELERISEEKSLLEKQLNAVMKSKLSQTPHPTISLTEDMDKEMEKQYKIVCDRNKWLENRISSLLREIELLRDQNSLLLEEKNAAERDANAMEGELKNVALSSKSARQQKELEQIHLQNSNAEKIQQILSLKSEIREKDQVIQALTKEISGYQKKSDRKKITAFMKKLRKPSDSRNEVSPEKSSLHRTMTDLGSSAHRTMSSFGGTMTSPFRTQGFDDYNSLAAHEQEQNGSYRARSNSTPGNIAKFYQDPEADNFRYVDDPHLKTVPLPHQKDHAPAMPETMKGLSPSPTLTMTARKSDSFENDRDLDPIATHYISDTGERLMSPSISSSPKTYTTTIQALPDPPRKFVAKGIKKRASDSTARNLMKCSSNYDSDEEDERKRISTTQFLFDPPSQFRGLSAEKGGSDRKRSYSSDRQQKAKKSREKRAVLSADELDERRSKSGSARLLDEPLPVGFLPSPAPAPTHPTPGSSPSILSPKSARYRSIPVYVTSPNDEGVVQAEFADPDNEWIMNIPPLENFPPSDPKFHQQL